MNKEPNENNQPKEYWGKVAYALLYILSADAFAIYTHILRRRYTKKKDGSPWDIRRSEIATSLNMSLTRVQNGCKELQTIELLKSIPTQGAQKQYVFDENVNVKWISTKPSTVEVTEREVIERPH